MGRHNAGSAGCQDRAASSWRIGDGPLRGEGQSSNAMGRSVGIQRGGEAGRLYLRPALRAPPGGQCQFTTSGGLRPKIYVTWAERGSSLNPNGHRDPQKFSLLRQPLQCDVIRQCGSNSLLLPEARSTNVQRAFVELVELRSAG